ncbi:hypothetical protein EB796_003186 [Bugula neritina]|uniref:Uncharacterized protein n=1 Tax=Bugula neritina TaxID=10212 RepID=A0A7J7KL93_BUGNE|nr:hypothetical protein EB796_003186 [Bugula neritina]
MEQKFSTPDSVVQRSNGKRRTDPIAHFSWNEAFKYRIHSVNNSDEADQNIGVVDVGKEFCSRTTSQGITQVFQAPQGSKRIFWVILTLTALALLIGHLYYLIHTFIQFETSTEVTVIPAKLLSFPAVTVCNNNAVRKSSRDRSLPGEFSELFDEVADFLALNDVNAGHQKEDLIVKAIFDNHFLNISKDFTLTMNARHGNLLHIQYEWLQGNKKSNAWIWFRAVAEHRTICL